MKVFCKECKIELSKELVELSDSNLLNEEDEKDFIPTGYFTKSDGEFFTGTEEKLIINIHDLINAKNYPDFKRLNGCCGLDGMDGLNKVCINGHEIGTAKEDCWMPHCVIFEPNQIIIK
ncbi:MAG: hypothetical protein OEY34_04260 [Cyclobacteriaceae bacterium]|nr:hypothetical protein [Cyclobacteriaceae bacterium]